MTTITKVTPTALDFKVNPQTGEAFISIRKTAEFLDMPESTLRDHLSRTVQSDTKLGINKKLAYEILQDVALNRTDKHAKQCVSRLKYLASIGSTDINDLIGFTGEKSKNKGKKGFVYLMRCEDYYKIGVSQTSVESRVNGMLTGNPFEIITVHSKHVKNCYQAERFLHNKYKLFHHRGEWFTGIDVEEVITTIDNI